MSSDGHKEQYTNSFKKLKPEKIKESRKRNTYNLGVFLTQFQASLLSSASFGPVQHSLG